MNARVMLVAAVAAAAAVTSACSPTVTGTASPASEAGPAPAPGTVAAAPLVVGSQNTWIDVTGRGNITQLDSVPPTQYSSTPRPGITAVSDQQGEGRRVCTLGPAIRGSNGDGFAIAGHCGEVDPVQRLQLGPNHADIHDYASVSDRAHGVFDPVSGMLLDSAALWGGAVGPAAVRIADTWPVAGVMTRNAVSKLPKGTSVCFDGAVSAVTCGPLIDTDSAGELEFGIPAVKGDSGSAVFLVDGNTGAATLVGIVASTQQGHTYATYLEPALTHLSATALVDPAAANVVSGDPRYSTRVAPLT